MDMKLRDKKIFVNQLIFLVNLSNMKRFYYFLDICSNDKILSVSMVKYIQGQ